MTLPLKAFQKTILVVEDTALVLNTVRMILENASFTVLAAASTGEAMRLAGCAKTIDLLLFRRNDAGGYVRTLSCTKL